MARSFEDKLAEQQGEEAAIAEKKRKVEEAKQSGRPQILNLNEDGMLDRKIFLDLSESTNARVGRKSQNQDDMPEVTLGGIGIQQQHANFVTTGDRTNLVPSSLEAAEHTYINGRKLTSADPVELKPNDRIIFGTGTCLLYRCQTRDSEVEMKDDPANPISYEFAMNEKGKIENEADNIRKEQEKAEAEAKAAAQIAALKAEMEAEKAE